MSDDLVALVNNRRADEANVNGRSFPRHADRRFYVPADVAQALLALPAGFAAAPDEQPIIGIKQMDFLALDPAGNPQPFAQLEVSGPSGRYQADEHGIIHDVKSNHAGSLLVCGAIPLTPAGWVDPRPVTIK
jgi:hypothetical protein